MALQDEILARGTGVQSRPAVAVVLVFAAGILTGHHVPYISPGVLLLFAGSIFIVGLCTFRYRLFPFAAVTLLFVCGFAKQQSDMRAPASGILAGLSDPPQNVLIWGTICDRPQLLDERVRFTIRTDSLTDGRIVYRIGRDILVNAVADARYDKSFIPLEYGDYLVVHGRVSIPPTRRNPYEPDVMRMLSLNNISALMYVRGYYNIERLDTRGNIFIRSIIVPVRIYIADRIDTWIEGESAHFLRGLLLGDRSRIDRTVRDAFVSAGVIHILAVSGLHVGIITVIFYSVLGFFRLNRLSKILCTILGLLVFMFVTGAMPSVVRATIMASVVLIGVLVQRRSDIYNSIAIAALILLLFDTRELFKPSFQLSFAAVIAIISIYPVLRDIAHRIFPSLKDHGILYAGVQLFLVSTAAQIGTLPFTAVYFERISIVAFAANLIVIPAVGLIISFGFAMLVIGLVHETIGQYYAETSNLLLDGILRFVEFVGHLPYASIELFGFTILHGILYYCVIIVLINLNRPFYFKTGIFALLIFSNVYIYTNILQTDFNARPLLRLTLIDVGQGDAILVEFPHGEVMLYDAGPKTVSSDAGERTVVPFLKRNGIRAIDAAVISHAHADHFGGFAAVLREIEVRSMYESGQPSSNAWYREVLDQLEAKGIPRVRVQAGDIIEGVKNVRLYVLHPSPDFVQSPGDNNHWNLNNASVVILIQYGMVRIILTGDAEMEAERYMVYIYHDFLDSEILKVGHHGSSTSSTERFIDLISPEKALISVGRLNRFRHPSNTVIDRLNDKKVSIYRTDYHGASVVETCGREVHVSVTRSAP
jgi:competence protein ComEC